MANALNEDVTGRVIVVKQEVLKPEYIATELPFRCEDGFGCFPHTSGTHISGVWLSDGEQGSIRGYDIDRYATEDEISATAAKRTEGQ
jgi:hypothetical protein